MIALYRIIKMGFQNFWRNKWLSVATISVMVLTLLIVSLFVVSNFVLNTTVSFIYEKMDISAFLKDPVEPGETLKYELVCKNNSTTKLIFTLEDDLLKILPYITIEDSGGGTVKNGKISWSKLTLSSGETLIKTYKIKIKSKDQWPAFYSPPKSSLLALPEDLFFERVVYNDTKNEKIFENLSSNEIILKLFPDEYQRILDGLKSALSQDSEVKNVVYVSKEDAARRFKVWYTERKEILEYIMGKNPLLASLEVKLVDPNKTESIKSILEREDYTPIIEKVSYEEKKNQETIRNLLSITNFVKRGGLILSLVFISISLLIIFNTIRINIFTRGEEIEIMQLVGASRFFTEGPFMIEGIIYGFIATLISILLFYPILIILAPKLIKYYGPTGQSLVSYFFSHLYQVLGLQLLIGIFIGLFSSLLALGKYLKRI